MLRIVEEDQQRKGPEGCRAPRPAAHGAVSARPPRCTRRLITRRELRSTVMSARNSCLIYVPVRKPCGTIPEDVLLGGLEYIKHQTSHADPTATASESNSSLAG